MRRSRSVTVLALLALSLASACSASASVNFGNTPTPNAAPASANPSPTPLLGAIQGEAGYPGPFVPPLHIYAVKVDRVQHAVRVDTQASPLAVLTQFRIDAVPAGTYHLLAYAPDHPRHAAGYTRAVLCGLAAGCAFHALVPVPLDAGQVVTGVKVTDWYAPPGSLPPEPSL